MKKFLSICEISESPFLSRQIKPKRARSRKKQANFIFSVLRSFRFPPNTETASAIFWTKFLMFWIFRQKIEEEKQDEIKLAIIGRPNVGKSSLLNKILGEERVIVSPIAGTTRDSIDTHLTVEGQKFLMIDTAGIRRKGKTTEMAEKLSVVMARKSLERADVAILVIDAVEGVANLDASIAGYALDSGCSLIIAVNKWDILEEKETGTASEYERNLRDKLKFLDWAPLVTISALTGQRVSRILPIVAKSK